MLAVLIPINKNSEAQKKIIQESKLFTSTFNLERPLLKLS